MISEDLKDFVFIGLPASEAGNALILPLAGHELGHSIWRLGGVGRESEPDINATVIRHFLDDKDLLKALFGSTSDETLLDDQAVLSMLSVTCDIAQRQCEETFCDAIGVGLFGEAFLHSFEYLLIPSLGGDRLELYPPLKRRISSMMKAAELFGYELRFEHAPPVLETERCLPGRDRFAVSVADKAATELVPVVLGRARTYCRARGAPEVDMEIAGDVARDFARYFPGENTKYLGNVVNTGWLSYKNFAQFAPDVKDRGRAYDILNNLIFKSLEVLEYEAKVL